MGNYLPADGDILFVDVLLLFKFKFWLKLFTFDNSVFFDTLWIDHEILCDAYLLQCKCRVQSFRILCYDNVENVHNENLTSSSTT